MYKTIIYEVKDNIAYVTVNRPEALNALNPEVLNELYDAFNKIKDDNEVGAVIVTGAGRAFVAGADIVAMSGMAVNEGRELAALGHKVMNFIDDIEKPVIAAVNGFALGGGCELSMACDIRIASSKAKFGQPETGLGITPGFGGTQRLSRLVGKGMAKYLIYTADVITAEEAKTIGLIEKVVEPDQLIPEAEALAKKLLTKAPFALKLAKTVINRGYDVDLKAGCQLEIEAFGACFGTADQKEGMKAFIEKRTPEFTNK